MTAIAYDGKTLAADGRTTSGDQIISDDAAKITIAHGRIYAVAGAVSMLDALVEWHNAGADPKMAPPYNGDLGWNLIVVDRKGLRCYGSKIPYAHYGEYGPLATFGSGSDYAMGALLAGKSAKEAVEIACKLNVHSGGKIQVINIADALAPLKEAAE